MEQSNNVVLFPKAIHRVDPNSPVPSKQEVNENIDQNKQYHIQETINFLTPILFSHLNIAGFSPDGEDEFSVKEGAFIVEAIRSHMFSHYGLKHPFQKIVDKVFVKEEGDAEGVLTIARDIKVSLNVSD
jgi:hypothetical protein